jgi:hypothetical protein
MKASAQGPAGRLQRLEIILCALIGGLAPVYLAAAGIPGTLQTTNIETVIYGSDFFKPVAVLKIDRIYTDHRRLGFFHIKLLPVLVADGVHLDLAQARPQTNWLDGFRFDPAPAVDRRAVEWRDFSVSFAPDKSPRLQARRVLPTVNADSVVCRLEGVTVQAGSEPITVPKAELRAEGQSGHVVWTQASLVIQWDLFTGQCQTNSIKGAANEKP